MMGRQRWRGLGGRGVPAATDPGDAACAGDAGIAPVDPEPEPGEAPPGPQVGQTGQTGQASPAGETSQPAQPRVPAWLERAAGWAWRLLILAALIYVLIRLVGALRLVVLPC